LLRVRLSPPRCASLRLTPLGSPTSRWLVARVPGRQKRWWPRVTDRLAPASSSGPTDPGPLPSPGGGGGGQGVGPPSEARRPRPRGRCSSAPVTRRPRGRCCGPLPAHRPEGRCLESGPGRSVSARRRWLRDRGPARASPPGGGGVVTGSRSVCIRPEASASGAGADSPLEPGGPGCEPDQVPRAIVLRTHPPRLRPANRTSLPWASCPVPSRSVRLGEEHHAPPVQGRSRTFSQCTGLSPNLFRCPQVHPFDAQVNPQSVHRPPGRCRRVTNRRERSRPTARVGVVGQTGGPTRHHCSMRSQPCPTA
jgi:hypothetical protein